MAAVAIWQIGRPKSAPSMLRGKDGWPAQSSEMIYDEFCVSVSMDAGGNVQDQWFPTHGMLPRLEHQAIFGRKLLYMTHKTIK